jgi:tRNA pseudouridine32 synthase/23S rRNA pseudouridine746 synthase
MSAAVLTDRILYIDAEAIVLDKPSGLPVDAPRRGGDSIAARSDELKVGFRRPPTAMHRLDTDTSGCLLFARTAKARAQFQRAFETRVVEKYYKAVVRAIAGEVIDLRLPSDVPRRGKMVPDKQAFRLRAGGSRMRDVDSREFNDRAHAPDPRHARKAFGSGIPRVYGIPGPVLLHASGSFRGGASGDRRHRAATGLFRGMGDARPDDSADNRPGTDWTEWSLSETFTRNRAQAENINKVATAVQLRVTVPLKCTGCRRRKRSREAA